MSTKKILVVDDSDAIRQQVGAALRQAGYATAEAVDGVQGLELLKEGEFALVICDVKSEQAHDYVSGCPLGTPTGAMEGRYFMIAADGTSFPVDIPRFPLIAPAVAS